MFTKEELRQIRSEFWERFRLKMEKERSASGRRKNWLHYRSNIADLYFRLDFDGNEAVLFIDLQMKDEGVREVVWEQFMETKNILIQCVGDELQLLPSYSLSNHIEVHRMKWSLTGVSIFNPDDHGKAIDYLKEKIKGLDEFWSDYFDLFYALCN